MRLNKLPPKYILFLSSELQSFKSIINSFKYYVIYSQRTKATHASNTGAPFNANQTKLILLEMESIIDGPLVDNVFTYKVAVAQMHSAVSVLACGDIQFD